MASDFHLARIKQICETHGEESVIGCIIDSGASFFISPDSKFSLSRNIDEASDTLTMEVVMSGIDNNHTGKPTIGMVYIPIIFIHSLFVRHPDYKYGEYDVLSLCN